MPDTSPAYNTSTHASKLHCVPPSFLPLVQYLRMYTQMAGFNVLLFNYRGVSGSTGNLTQPGTVLDGEAMFEVLYLFNAACLIQVAMS